MSVNEVPQNLPREVLRWIQSLDLAYSVKNVKRDFSNGFLAAEIFSRYYAKEVSMHSYDNGNALKAKRDNWNQLLKLFRKIGMPQLLSGEEADFILRCEDNYAINFITKIYEVLTQRKVQTLVKKPTVGKVAGFAKETGSWKVKETMRKLDLREDSDQLTAMRKIAAAIDTHEKALQDERSLEPERYSITSSVALRSSVNGERQRNVNGTGFDEPQVRVKEIQVKQLDRNVTHLRASKQMQGSNSVGTSSSPTNQPRVVSPTGSKLQEKSYQGAISPSDRYASSQQPTGVLLAENAISVMNNCISRVLNPSNLLSWSSNMDPYSNLLAAIDLQKNGAELDLLLAETLTEIRLSSQQLAEACIITPKQFWKVSDLFCAVLIASPYQSESYLNGVETFESIGRWIAQRDPRSSLTLFTDFALFKLNPILISNPNKRLGLLRVLLSFSPQESSSHIQMIKRLQTSLPDLSVFISCLTILAAQETQMNESLLDLYLYYGTIGLGLPSPRLRAAAISVFSSLLPQTTDLVIDMLPQFLKMAKQESWWEIHAHILSICGSLVEIQATNPKNDSGGGDDDQNNSRNNIDGKSMDVILEIVKLLFSPAGTSKNLRQWGIIALAPAVTYGDPITSLYLNVLTAEETSDRLFFLGLRTQRESKTISLPSSTGIPFVLDPISARIDPYELSKGIVQTVQNSSLDRLELPHFEILLGCLQTTVDYSTNGDTEPIGGAWKNIYTSLKDYIFIGFCDTACCGHATRIMKLFIEKSPSHEIILKENRFLGVLRLLYPEDGSGNSDCQQVLEDFLRDVFNLGENYGNIVINVIELFAKNFVTQYEMSNLQSLLKEFMS